MATPLPDNRARFALDELATAMGGALVGEAVAVEGVVTDSRRVRPGCLYLPLRGERHDGHDFIAQAVQAGAAAVVVERGRGSELPLPRIEVDDTLRALGDAAALHRRRWKGKVIGVTGSAGKTTTKELTHAALSAAGARVMRTEGNLNNRIGAPLTVLTLDARHDFAVLELGTSEPGEIARLAEITAPDVGVVTAVAVAHAAGLGSLDAVAAEKAALLWALESDGVAIYSADAEALGPHLARVRARRMSFGSAAGADVQLLSHELGRELRTRCRYAIRTASGIARELDLGLALFGQGAALDAAAAIAVVEAVVGDSALDAARVGLASVRPTPGRMCPVRLPSGCMVIDDSYNANPASMAISIEAAGALARLRDGALSLVLADMKELGPSSEAEHARVGRAAVASGAARIVFCGPEMTAAVEAARCASKASAASVELTHVDDAGEATPLLAGSLGSDDVVLVKGSRSMTTERVVQALRAAAGGVP